jgi:hypothetical protein
MGKRQAWSVVLAVICCVAAARADDIRSWTDADGVVHFGDKYAAPEQSHPVELGEGTYLNMETPAHAASPGGTGDNSTGNSSAASNNPPAGSVTRTRPCMPLIQEIVDPVSGMHSQRDTGRCQEDEPVTGTVEGYPSYVYPCTAHGAHTAAGCARPHPRPHPKPHPVTPPASKPVSPATPRPFNQSPVDFSR